jgi:transposase
MSMHPQRIPDIPQATVEIARAAFPKGNLYMQIRDVLGSLYEDEAFVDLFSKRGQPAQSPWRVALVSVMQFMENLSDRQAADAVRARIDWKYALSLDLSDAGFDFSVLSEFRNRLVIEGVEQTLLDLLLNRLRDEKLLKTHQRQRTDSTHVLAAIRTLNRLEALAEVFRAALNSLTVSAPEWLATHMNPAWFDRYHRRMENYRLPKLDAQREALGNLIGADGFELLEVVYAPSAPAWLRQLPAIETLRQMWIQQYYAPQANGSVHWRAIKDLPPSTLLIHSPYDLQAHYSSKRSTDWIGYKVHLSEICDENHPRFITHVHTTLSTIPDDKAVEPIHQALSEKELLPKEHLMDAGYLAADHLVNCQTEYGVEIIGPVREDHSWQARAGQGFDATHFKLDWAHKTATCPQGHQSTKWLPGEDITGQPVINVRFLGTTCRACPVRSFCTHSKRAPRELTFRPQAQHSALQARRQAQHTPEFHELYSQRAGVEATHSQGIRRSALRQSRYMGLAKTHLQHVLIAVALNLIRLDAWVSEIPLAKTRKSRFMALQPQPA